MKNVIEKHIDYLISIGLKISDKKKLFNNLINKHFSRYEDIIKFLRKNSIPLTQEIVFATYRADIVIRREIDEILKAFELSLKTKVMICAEKLQWNLSDDGFKISFDDWTTGDADLRKKKNESKEFFLESTKKIIKKLNFNSWNSIVNEFQFGQIVSLLQVVDKKTFETMFEMDKNILLLTKDAVTNNLETINQLRNLIAHVNILLKNKPFLTRKFAKIKIATAIDCLHSLTKGDYRHNLTQKIDAYKSNCLLQENDSDWSKIEKEDIEKIFLAIKKELIHE